MKPDVKKIIADIKATKGNRKFCNGLAGTLQDDNYASSICKYVKTVTPERIDLLIEYAEKLEAEVTDMAVQLANAESKCREIAWIEGNEPSEYGRYWVRYETDVGPQYCSAKWMEHNFCAGSNTNIHKIWLADHSRSINSLRGVTHYTKLPDSLEGAAQ
ncbi:hypothetical protein OLN68_18505 [Citrobacter freundii]|uniref:hypothetical protein n=1 Tax=Citrobacter braakii TaxID=57706 RepID=UPI001CC36840|nr:hypothetical protein [Citrobacter braakii]MCW1436110.1 hypothetical protein [Citrobacter freundii]MCW1447634.1 hypothetical protein [Citrobacter freundii]